MEWPGLLSDCSWLHVSGITPLVSPQARKSWQEALKEALRRKLPVSLDLNHRPQLGTLEELWEIVKVFCEALELLILSYDQLQGLALLLFGSQVEDSDGCYLSMMARLRDFMGCRRLALCRKTRHGGVQSRWSLWVDASGAVASEPLRHVVRDECGGGSAWAAGVIAALREQKAPREAMKRGDLLAALCQEPWDVIGNVGGKRLQACIRSNMPRGPGVNHFNRSTRLFPNKKEFKEGKGEAREPPNACLWHRKMR